MQSAESGLQLAAALAITRASRQAGATAAQKCSDAADAFYGSGCACEPAVVLGLKFVDIVPRRAKEALLETAKKCPVAGAAALPRGENDASVSLAEGISLLESFLDSVPPSPPLPPPLGERIPVIEKNGGGAPLKG